MFILKTFIFFITFDIIFLTHITYKPFNVFFSKHIVSFVIMCVYFYVNYASLNFTIYNLFRKIEGKNMKNILIIGVARTGKTTLSKMVKQKYNEYNLIHSDSIIWGIIRGEGKEEYYTKKKRICT